MSTTPHQAGRETLAIAKEAWQLRQQQHALEGAALRWLELELRLRELRRDR